MIELSSETKFNEILQNNSERLLLCYFHTPLCGTCKLASTYLRIVEKTDGIPVIYKININFFSNISEAWGISSVPSLVAFRKNKELGRIYAFQSVTHIYEFIQLMERTEEL